MYTYDLTFKIPADDADEYRDAIPVPAESLPITTISEWFRSQEHTNPAAATDAAHLLLAQIGERAETHVITGADVTYALAAGSDLTYALAAADSEDVWDAATDAQRRLREHYPHADMSDYLVLPYDTKADEIAALCGECTAYITNAERPDDPAYTALLDDFDRDICPESGCAPRLRMCYGVIEAEHTEGACAVCERDFFDSPDDGRANIWAY